MSLPVTTVPERRKAVLTALLKISEVGLFRWLTKKWVPDVPKQLKEDLRFSPAGFPQVSGGISRIKF